MRPALAATCLLLGACAAPAPATPGRGDGRAPDLPQTDLFPVDLHVPEGLGEFALAGGLPLAAGSDAVRVPCATCHGAAGDDALRSPPSIASRAGTDGRFHAVALAHGQLACVACHDERQRDRLHLADGRTLPFDDVMALCAQCHGPQTRDYRHGSHGGMNGFWDLTRGPRTRNNCVDCHRPHDPAYRPVMPVLPPRDRWLAPTGGGH